MHSVPSHGAAADATVPVDGSVRAMIKATSDHMHSNIFPIHYLLKLRPIIINICSTGLAVEKLKSVHVDQLEGMPILQLLLPSTLRLTLQILVDFSFEKQCLRSPHVVVGRLVIMTVAKSIQSDDHIGAEERPSLWCDEVGRDIETQIFLLNESAIALIEVSAILPPIKNANEVVISHFAVSSSIDVER